MVPKTLTGIILIALVAATMTVRTADSGSQADSTPAPDLYERNQAMQKGINMGNALEAPDIGAWREELLRALIPDSPAKRHHRNR